MVCKSNFWQNLGWLSWKSYPISPSGEYENQMTAGMNILNGIATGGDEITQITDQNSEIPNKNSGVQVVHDVEGSEVYMGSSKGS